MAQGKFKKASAGPSSVLAKKHQKKELTGPKKREGKAIAPKHRALISQKTLQKKLSAKSIVQTERLMAARAGATGKLTIMKKLGEQAKAELDKAKAKK
ncbi:uncharacterized protein EV422DRAFT_514598 [Fimicolochytrium jonesii]|uniref:uncharacterized protein n=1 Tax=Fimicolochytrium jonesii TaxID=1396493 RepID=UPI0022FF0D10|nr:uncharacterized protein EV422DRAFT_514598 [Fimicolochytrium jonesii]KAI8825893.1 hypothetical protein EV422DRAFT_514598 [Fimicolochytrium jonesii]